MRDVLRITVIDARGRVSFVAPCQTLEGFVAACAAQPKSLDELLEVAAPFVGGLAERVRSGLAVFDEHTSPTNTRWIVAALDSCQPPEAPVFRVLDARTEELSLTPLRAGVVVFNLLARRIVQIQNTYAEIRRRGRVRVVHDGRATPRVHSYELPADWSVVPLPSA
ncbi:MAG: hypothetical protein HYX52_00685 [Chloroflexi bacterium]|nr:hypothetical protein [Chloroflexota bacterium]